MGYETLKLDIDARGVARLTMARPDKHNAMNARVIGELADAAAAIAGDARVRAVVLAGEGKIAPGASPRRAISRACCAHSTICRSR